MRIRVLVHFALLGVACFLPHAGPGGLLERSPPEMRAVLVHLVVPSALAVALTVFQPRMSWHRAILSLAGCLLLAQIVRMALYAHPSGHQLWNHLMIDSKDQFLLLLSLSMQVASGLLVFMAARLFARRVARSAASADAGSPRR